MLHRFIPLLVLLSLLFAAACNKTKSSDPAAEAAPVSEVKKVKVGNKTMTLEVEEEEDDEEAAAEAGK